MDIDADSHAAPVGSIGRTLHVLRALGTDGPVTLTELSRSSGLSKPTALRFLRAMAEEGFAKQNADGAWALTTLLWQLGCAAIDYDHTGRDAAAVLQEVVETTKETAVYALYEDGHTVYVEQVSGPHAVRTHIALGSRVRATATATGRCSLAYQDPEEIARVLARHLGGEDVAGLSVELDTIRRQGHAFNRDGMWRNVWGLAAPVADRHGRVIGAVGVSGPADRLPADLGPVVAAVRDGADRLTRIHGGRPAGGRP